MVTSLPVTTSTKELALQQDTNLYPNPVESIIQIEFPSHVLVNHMMFVFNVNGNSLKSISLDSRISLINPYHLLPGLYIYSIMDKEGKTISYNKFVKL